LLEFEEEGDAFGVVFLGLFAAAEGLGGVDGGVQFLVVFNSSQVLLIQ